MLIRCEQCQALFSLQDGVVRGAPGPQFAVQCGRCLAVFSAASPKAVQAGQKGTSTPAQGTPALGSPRVTPQAVQKVAMRPPPAMPSASSETRGGDLAAALKPRRPGDAPEDDPFAQELAARARMRKRMLWAVIGAATLGALVLGGLALKKSLGGLPAAAQQKMEKARQKLAMDDYASMEQAAGLLSEAAKLAPNEASPEGERAFALLMIAGAHKEQADRLEVQARELNDQIAKLQLEKPEGYEAKWSAIAEQVKKIDNEREPHVREAQRLVAQGRSAALSAIEEDPEEASAQRAMGLFWALSEGVERGQHFVDKAEQLQPGNPLNAYVKAALSLAGAPSKEKQERGLMALGVVRQADPKFLRAAYEAAVIDAERQQQGAARQALNSILEQNPAHERAKALLATLPSAQ
ncbi:MAG: hypothetical protein JST92_14035 [Deltaproteobacteria bacterium]|nr:hypothetical protein [Deltaproteobacteria bacterium]